MKEYKVTKYAHNKWSIDQYEHNLFICQIAFWFKSPGAARRRLNEIIAEEAKLNWGKVAISCDLSVWKADYKGCSLEMDLEKTRINIMHDEHDGQTIAFQITPEGLEFLSCSGEDYCEEWTDSDWLVLENSIEGLK